MEDKYFDDKIKGILESPPTYEVPPSSVVDMQSRLQMARSGPRKRKVVGLVIPFLLIPILLMAGYFWQKMELLNHEITQLKTQLLNTKNQSQQQNLITYQYDTIYNVIYKEKYVPLEKSAAPMSEQHYGLKYPLLLPRQINQVNASKMNFTWSPGNTGLSLLNRWPGSSFFNSPDTDEQVDKTSPTNELNYLDLLAIQKFQTPGIQKEELEPKLKEKPVSFGKKKISPIAYITPTSFSIRGNYNPTAWMQNDHGSTGRVLGVSSAIEFPQNRSIEIGAEYFDFGFHLNPEALPNIPIAPPNNAGDILKEAKAKMACIQIPFNIRHIFLKKSAIQPTLSTGIVAAIPLQQEFTYEYIDGAEEYYKSINADNGAITIDNLRIGLGAQYSIWKNISIDSEVQYQHGISKDETALFPIRYWSLRFGLNYRI